LGLNVCDIRIGVHVHLLVIRAVAGYSFTYSLFDLGLDWREMVLSILSATRFDGLLIHVARSIYRSASGTVVVSSSGRVHGTGNVQMVLLEDARRYASRT
jgi:hypothetical protein